MGSRVSARTTKAAKSEKSNNRPKPSLDLSQRKELLFVTVIMLAMLGVAESLSKIFLPPTWTYSEIMNKFGPNYPVVTSDYLPFTTPKSMSFEGDDKPGSNFGRLEFNALGYRGPDPATISKPAGVQRLLVLGDSFVLGWGIRDESKTIPGRLRDLLNPQEAKEKKWEVINAGYHDGYSEDAYYAYLRKEGMELKPDAVAILVFSGNDVADIEGNVWEKTDDLGAPISLYSIRTYTNYHGGLLNSRILPWQYQVPLLRDSRLFLSAVKVIQKYIGEGPVDLTNGSIGIALSLDEAWKRFRISTLATVNYLRQESVPIVYVSFYWLGTPTDQDLYFESIRKLLVDELKVPYRPLHDQLGASHQLPGDWHPNEEGARIIADSIMQLLRQSVDLN